MSIEYIRKLRKKLRQVERLELTDRPLTEEELLKVAHKDDFRLELLELINSTSASLSDLQTSGTTVDDSSDEESADGEEIHPDMTLDETPDFDQSAHTSSPQNRPHTNSGHSSCLPPPPQSSFTANVGANDNSNNSEVQTRGASLAGSFGDVLRDEDGLRADLASDVGDGVSTVRSTDSEWKVVGGLKNDQIASKLIASTSKSSKSNKSEFTMASSNPRDMYGQILEKVQEV